MLTKWQVRNFKSIVDSGVIQLRPLTIFAGPNSAGKSNMQESLAIFAQTTRLEPTVAPSLSGSVSYGEFFTYPQHNRFEFIAHKGDLSREISFEVNIDLKKHESSKISEFIRRAKALMILKNLPSDKVSTIGYTYSYKPETNETSQSIFLNTTKLIGIGYHRVGPSTYQTRIDYPKKFEGTPLGISAEEMFRVEGLGFVAKKQDETKTLEELSSITKEALRLLTAQLTKVFFISALRGLTEATLKVSPEPSWVGKHCENVIGILALCTSTPNYKNRLKKITEWTLKFKIGEISAGWRGRDKISADFEDPVFKIPLDLALASFGSRQALGIITQIFWGSPGDVIMIEEPEMSLHPESQVLLQELFAEAIKEGKQIIYSTHSPFLILALSRLIKQKKLSTQDIAVYHFEKKTEKGTTVKKLKLDKHGFVKGWIPSYIAAEDEIFREWAESLE